MIQMGPVIKPWGYLIMSKPENNDDAETSKYIKTILVVIACVIIWIALQSVIGVPLKM
jgi:uncharacterized membrane-anchored protein